MHGMTMWFAAVEKFIKGLTPTWRLCAWPLPADGCFRSRWRGLLNQSGCFFSRMTSAIPPRIATDANTRRMVMGSPRKTMPPRAERTGTLSCTVAALVVFNAGNAAYQMAYPMRMPARPTRPRTKIRHCPEMNLFKVSMLNAAATGTARRKSPAVTLGGSPAPLPRKE